MVFLLRLNLFFIIGKVIFGVIKMGSNKFFEKGFKKGNKNVFIEKWFVMLKLI